MRGQPTARCYEGARKLPKENDTVSTFRTFGPFGDPRVMVELARAADAAGWDGLFIWDHVLWTAPENYAVTEPWVTLGAMAQSTERIRLGALVTPLPRRRPWQVARQAVTLDQLSNGRAVLGVGIGGDWFGDYSRFGEPADDRTHGAQLDEALAVVAGLWSGRRSATPVVSTTGSKGSFCPRRCSGRAIDLVAGVWPGTKPFRRAARYDGVAPISRTDGVPISPDDVRAIRAFVAPLRDPGAPFDVVLSGAPLAPEQYAAFAEAGATWYQDGFMADDLGRDRAGAHPARPACLALASPVSSLRFGPHPLTLSLACGRGELLLASCCGRRVPFGRDRSTK